MNHEQQFAYAMDACLEKMRQGESVEQALSTYPDRADELRPLLEISVRVAELPQPNASMTGLMRTLGRIAPQGASQQGPSQPPTKTGWFSRAAWVRAAAIVLLVFLAGWGSVTAAADSTSGDLLYPVKLLTERARFFLTLDHEDRAELRIIFSSRRLREAVLQQQRTGQLDPQLLSAMLDQARLAVLEAPELPEPARDLLVCQAAHLTDYQYDALGRLVTTADPKDQQLIERYRDMCEQRSRWMRQMLPSPSDASEVGVQRSQHQQPSSRHWRQWRDACPRW